MLVKFMSKNSYIWFRKEFVLNKGDQTFFNQIVTDLADTQFFQ